jgi:hypothetical protein
MPYQQWIIPGTNNLGHSISIDKASRSDPYVATLWEHGIPVTRKPIPTDKALRIIAESKATLITY